MRSARSIGVTKIFPSPICPVLAAAESASVTWSSCLSSTATLDTQLGEEVHGVFGAAVDLHVTLLPPEALDLGDSHAGNADPGEGFAHLVEFEWFDDGDYQLHGFPSGMACNENPFDWLPVRARCLR